MVSYTKGSLEQVWKRVGTEICGRWLDEPPVNQTLSKASQTKCFPNKRKKSLVSSLLTFSEEILLSFHTTARCCFYADLSFCKAPLCVVWLFEKHFSTTRVKSLNGTLIKMLASMAQSWNTHQSCVKAAQSFLLQLPGVMSKVTNICASLRGGGAGSAPTGDLHVKERDRVKRRLVNKPF